MGPRRSQSVVSCSAGRTRRYPTCGEWQEGFARGQIDLDRAVSHARPVDGQGVLEELAPLL